MSRIASALSGALAAALLLSPVLARAQAQWDQAKVTAIAQDLATSLRDLRVTVEKNPTQPGGSMRAAQYQAREDLRLLVNTSDRLALVLKDGEGKLETLPIYRRIEQIRRDAADSARRGDIPGPTQEKIAKAQQLLSQLEPYYVDVAAQ